MSKAVPKILIVGGGPSGLVLALTLLHNGIPVRIVERDFKPRLGQRGAGIMPRSLELFACLRIIDEVKKRAIFVPMVRKYKMPEGREVLQEFPMSPRTDPTPTNPFLNPMLLGQDKLEQIFHAALAHFGCTVEKGTELQSFEQFKDRVEVNLLVRGRNGDQEEQEKTSYEWMIGTDGAKSGIRKRLDMNFLGETWVVEHFVVGDIFVEGLNSKYWHMWGDPSDVLISLRPTESPKLFNFIIAGTNIENSQVSASHDTVRQCLRDHVGKRTDLRFVGIPWMSQYKPNIRMVDNLRKGRVFLAGDAGHVHSPTGGQGMNTGIQDSFNLGWKLALVVKGLAQPSLLDSYSNERIPVIAEMLDQTSKILKTTFQNKSERPWKLTRGLFQLGVNYRWSSIVLDERKILESRREAEEDALMDDFDYENDEKADSYGDVSDGRLRAGDRAPDSSGLVISASLKSSKKPCQLFQIFGPSYHTALIFVDLLDCNPILKAIAHYPKDLIHSVVILRPKQSIPPGALTADFVLEDQNGHAYEAYTTTVCGLILVRPDGVVGAICKGPDSLHHYFQKLLASP